MAISRHGTYILVGAIGSWCGDHDGRIDMFSYNMDYSGGDNNWNLIGTIVGSNQEEAGRSAAVSESGQIVVIGAPTYESGSVSLIVAAVAI